MPPDPVVSFGSSENSFYVGCGLKHYAPGLPTDLVRALTNLPALNMAWLALDGKGEVWVARDKNRGVFNYSMGLPDTVAEGICGTAEYVTFGSTSKQYFVKLGPDRWNASLRIRQTQTYQKIRASWGDMLDEVLTGIIFGKGETMIYMFQVGFLFFYTDKEAKRSKIKQVLEEYDKGHEWVLEPGSSLCQWNIDYFYLIFKHKSAGKTELRWNLPEIMETKLKEMQEYTDTPEGRQEIEEYQQREVILSAQRNEKSQILLAQQIEMSLTLARSWEGRRMR